MIALCFLLSALLSAVRGSHNCPTIEQRNTLVANPSTNALVCDCSPDESSGQFGWEINCFRDSFTKTDEYTVSTAFSVKYVQAKFVEIECQESSPNFHSAMFQGFGVDEVDTFRIINCPLPSVPFNLIFHRTSISNAKERNGKRQISGSSGSVIGVVRSLRLQTNVPSAIDVHHLKRLFYGLDSLESLSLTNYQLTFRDEVKRESKRSVTLNSLNYTANPIEYSIAERLTTETTLHQTTTIITTISANDELRKAETKKVENETTMSANVTRKAINATSKATTTKFTTNNVNVFNVKHNSVNVTRGPEKLDTQTSNAVQYRKLNYTFGQFLPKLKSLLLHSFLTSDSPANSFVLKELLSDLKNLENLDLNSNNIRVLPRNLLENSGLSLKRLYLLRNKIAIIEGNAFSNLKALEILDLSNNELNKIPEIVFKDLVNLKQISLSRNRFQEVNEKLFAFTTELNSIAFDLNTNLTQFPPKLLNGLNSLKSFSFNDCNLRNISSNPETFFGFASNLERIEMRNNRLKSLTATNMFAFNSKLTKLDISYNDIEVISHFIFGENSSNLIDLNLYANNLKTLSDDVFFYLKHLKTLNLGFNNLTQVKPTLFYNLVNLEELILNKNQLTNFNSAKTTTPFGVGKNLRKVDLSSNRLTNFNEFEAINWSVYLYLEVLDLSKNQFSGTVEIPIFHAKSDELILDLRNNEITSVNILPLESFENSSIESNREEKVDFNEIRNIKLNHLIVRLDNNPLYCDCNFHPFLKYAKRLSGTVENGVLKRASFELSSPKLTCSSPGQLANKSLAEVGLNELTCDINEALFCPQGCRCLYRPEDETAVIDCEKKGVDSIPLKAIKLSNYKGILVSPKGPVLKIKLIVLNLRHNNITDLAPLSYLLSNNVSVSQKKISLDLFLDYNKIVKIPNDLMLQPSNKPSQIALRVLSLRHNRLESIPQSFLSDYKKYLNASNEGLMKYTKLYLGSNPYNCDTDSNKAEKDCDIRIFKSWLVSWNHVVADNNDVSCESLSFNSTSTIIHIPDNILCPQMFKGNQTLLLALAAVTGILAFLLCFVTILYYKNKQTILAFVYIHLHPVFVCFQFSEDDIDEDKVYDAFVSYSSADRDIVMQLIEKLEKPSKVVNKTISYLQSQVDLPSIHEGNSDQLVPDVNKDILEKPNGETGQESEKVDYFQLCIHERDWLPGNLISWNIVNSVQNSRRTILILSKEFIQSIWFQVEFHTAYYQMLEDKIDRLIVIVKGQLPPKEEMDKDLVFLLTTKTYLVWGEKWFWEKLRYALPHKKRSTKQMSESSNSATLGPPHKSKSPSKNEMMKEYVEQTIANHFQLNSSDSLSDRNNKNKSYISNLGKNDAKTSTAGVINESFVIESQT